MRSMFPVLFNMQYSISNLLKLVLVSCLLIQTNLAAQDEEAFPFDRIGEELEYSMKWGFFKVGYGYLRVLPITEVNGERCYHVALEVGTNSFADAFYRVRSIFQSFISVEHNRPVLYRINQHEGSTDRDATVYFDWENLTATYQRDGEAPKEPVEIEEMTWDPLSVVYFFRRVLSPDGDAVSLPATDGKKFLLIDVKYLGLTKLKSQFGETPSMKVEPNTKEMKGVFKKSKDSNITMWYSNDGDRYPLLIRSKVIVGSFNAEMKKQRQLNEAEIDLVVQRMAEQSAVRTDVVATPEEDED